VRRCFSFGVSLIFIAVLLISNFHVADAAKRKGSGQVRFRNAQALSDQVSVLVFGASQPDAGTHYEGWLGTADGTAWVDIGRIDLDAKGNSTVNWASPGAENLLARYDQFLMTVETDGSTVYWPAEAHIAFRGYIPPEVVPVVRKLAVAGPDTPLPDRVGLATGMKAQASGLSTEGRDARSAAQKSNLKTLSRLDEQLLNRIVGVDNGAYGDLNGNGVVEDKSDTYGIRRYAQAIQPLVQPLASNDALPSNVKDRASRIITATNNILEWTGQIRNLAHVLQPTMTITDVQIIQSDIAWLAKNVSDGTDLNGDYKVDDAIGEGGARSVYTNAQDLGRIYFRAVNQ
jgi:hypothetical protein